FNRATANLGISQRFNRVSLVGEGRYVNLNYVDTPAAGAGEINNDDRDRDVYVLALRAGYEIVPRFEAFVRGSYNVRDYEARLDDFGIDRDSDGYELAVGTQVDLTGITFGEAYVGYRQQAYDDRRLDKIDGITFGARLTSNITPLTTVQLFVDRDIEETSIVAAEGFWSTSVRATVDHELLRNLILSGALGYGWNDYQGADRDDDTIRATIGANYLMNRYLTVGVAYDFEWRESRGRAAGVDYTVNRILLKVTGHL
ncbi:MAG TPA: outer membrane beta-barrel protein, partial [Vicinamibacterales bacterium]|nr:outer membrane beta-barrel protein [Vicinamibacterales bacterium]